MEEKEQFIRELIKEKTRLINTAEFEKISGNIETSKEFYKNAANKEFEITKHLEDIGKKDYFAHLFSAAWCAWKANEYSFVSDILDKLEKIKDLNIAQADEVAKIKSRLKLKIRSS